MALHIIVIHCCAIVQRHIYHCTSLYVYCILIVPDDAVLFKCIQDVHIIYISYISYRNSTVNPTSTEYIQIHKSRYAKQDLYIQIRTSRSKDPDSQIHIHTSTSTNPHPQIQIHTSTSTNTNPDFCLIFFHCRRQPVITNIDILTQSFLRYFLLFQDL